MIGAVELRPACPADGPALIRLAQLDSARVPAGQLLVAQSDGALQVALSLETGEAIADPFVPTEHLIVALRAHAARPDERRTQWTRPCQPMPAT